MLGNKPALRIYVAGNAAVNEKALRLTNTCNKDKVLCLLAKDLDAKEHGRCLFAVIRSDTDGFDTLTKVKDTCKDDDAKKLLPGTTSFFDFIDMRKKFWFKEQTMRLIIAEMTQSPINLPLDARKKVFSITMTGFFSGFVDEENQQVSAVDLDSPESAAEVVKHLAADLTNRRVQIYILPTHDDSAPHAAARIKTALEDDSIDEIRGGKCEISVTCDWKTLHPSLTCLKWDDEMRPAKCPLGVACRNEVLVPGVINPPALAVHPGQRAVIEESHIEKRKKKHKKHADSDSESSDEEEEKNTSLAAAKMKFERGMYTYVKKKLMFFDGSQWAVLTGDMGGEDMVEFKKSLPPHIAMHVTDMQEPLRSPFYRGMKGVHRGRKHWTMVAGFVKDGVIDLSTFPPQTVELLLTVGREVVVVSRAATLWLESQSKDLMDMVLYGENVMGKVCALATNRSNNDLRGNAAIHAEVQKKGSTLWNNKVGLGDLFQTIEDEARRMKEPSPTGTIPHQVELRDPSRKAGHEKPTNTNDWKERQIAKKLSVEKTREESASRLTKLTAWAKKIEAAKPIAALWLDEEMSAYARSAPCYECNVVHDDGPYHGCPKVAGELKQPKRLNEKNSFAAQVMKELKELKEQSK